MCLKSLLLQRFDFRGVILKMKSNLTLQLDCMLRAIGYCSSMVTTMIKWPVSQSGLMLNALFYLDCIRTRVTKLTLPRQPHAMSGVMWPLQTTERCVCGMGGGSALGLGWGFRIWHRTEKWHNPLGYVCVTEQQGMITPTSYCLTVSDCPVLKLCRKVHLLAKSGMKVANEMDVYGWHHPVLGDLGFIEGENEQGWSSHDGINNDAVQELWTDIRADYLWVLSLSLWSIYTAWQIQGSQKHVL